MIHEYGIEPELVVDWLVKEGPYAHALKAAFGVGTPRILSRYPPNWKRLVLSAWGTWAQEAEAAAGTDADRGRIQSQKVKGDAVVEGLVEGMVWREGLTWDDSTSWLLNAIRHAPEPLHTLLVRHAEKSEDHVLSGDAIFDSPRWNVPRSGFVSRDAQTLADTLAPFLRRSARIIFVDPWFRAEKGHMQAFEAFLRVMEHRPGLKRPSIEVHTSTLPNRKKPIPWEDFDENLRRGVSRLLPLGWQVEIRWLAIEGDVEYEPASGEKVHNRYVLSERGGVLLGAGLDAGKPSHHDDVHLMDRAHFDERWGQHTSSPLGFALARDGAKLVIKGEPRAAQLAPQSRSAPRRGR